MQDKVNNYLQHFGILGMKWGRRKGKTSLSKGKLKSVKNSNNHPDHDRKVVLKKKKLHQMSNEELKTLNTRLQLEKTYKELTQAEVSKGRKFVSEILSNAAKQTASTYVSKYMTKGVESAFNKAKDKKASSK